MTVKAYTSTFPLLHQFMSVGSRTVTYILLECSAPHCNHCSHKTLGVDTHITHCADGHSHQHHHDAQLCVPWIAYAIKQDFEQAWDWDHTQLCNLHHKHIDQEHMEINHHHTAEKAAGRSSAQNRAEEWAYKEKAKAFIVPDRIQQSSTSGWHSFPRSRNLHTGQIWRDPGTEDAMAGCSPCIGARRSSVLSLQSANLLMSWLQTK